MERYSCKSKGDGDKGRDTHVGRDSVDDVFEKDASFRKSKDEEKKNFKEFEKWRVEEWIKKRERSN